MTEESISLKLSQFNEYLQPRPRDWHKGNSGFVLIVGGDCGYTGAVKMAGLAALRIGAGLVTIATRKDHAELLSIATPELMCHGISSGNKLFPFFKKAKVIIAGPGLGQSSWASSLLQSVLLSELPVILDADALNLLAKKPFKNTKWILTPHPGEAARLLGITTEAVQKNRYDAVKKIQQLYGGVCILKGFGTLIMGPDGVILKCEAGNPGMATAGMGDVLSGVIGGLVAQGLPLIIAAKLGVLLHATAGDLAAKEGMRGMIATDLLLYLRHLVNNV